MKYQQTAPALQATAPQAATQAAPRRDMFDVPARPVRNTSNTSNRSKTRNYNPAPIRRCVRVAEKSPELSCGVTKSFTRHDENIEHRPEVDLVTGECRCSCEHFFFRLNPTAKKAGVKISIKTPFFHCKHLTRYIEGCVRRGELTRDAGKVLHLNHPQAAPVEKIVVPPHIDAETGELKPGYLPNGEFDYKSYFDFD